MRSFTTLILLACSTAASASSVTPAPIPSSWLAACPSPAAAKASELRATPLPTGVTGRVSFYASLTKSGVTQRVITLGDVDAVFPLASVFKPLVVHGIFRDVDAGKLKLTTRLTTTSANRSIEAYPQGSNEVRELARRAIYLSDNTASDILHLGYGPERLAREVRAASPCTTVLHTTKAWWAAQSSLLPEVVGPEPLPALRQLAFTPFEERLRVAMRLIQASQKVDAPRLEQVLDDYFHGPTYTPELEYYVQNTSTARAFTDLALRTFTGAGLKPATRDVFRTLMQTGCCRPKAPRMKTTYWGAKAGSGWRILTLSGAVELPDGRVMAYTYLNDQSHVTDAEDMERQIRPVVTWIESQLMTLSGSAK